MQISAMDAVYGDGLLAGLLDLHIQKAAAGAWQMGSWFDPKQPGDDAEKFTTYTLIRSTFFRQAMNRSVSFAF